MHIIGLYKGNSIERDNSRPNPRDAHREKYAGEVEERQGAQGVRLRRG
ncbi:MAG: hypothetical protein M3Y56_11520 [Armatimonadota bacterium]|nr:hypothetical protein [Armatimonadota bacterium]